MREDGTSEQRDGITAFPTPDPTLPVGSRPSSRLVRQLTFVSDALVTGTEFLSSSNWGVVVTGLVIVKGAGTPPVA